LEGRWSYRQGDPGGFGPSGLVGIEKVFARVLVHGYFSYPLLQSRGIPVEHFGMFWVNPPLKY
jgi:hypothetical protein